MADTNKNLKFHDFAKYPHGHPLPQKAGSYTWDGKELKENEEPKESSAPQGWKQVPIGDETAKAPAIEAAK